MLIFVVRVLRLAGRVMARLSLRKVSQHIVLGLSGFFLDKNLLNRQIVAKCLGYSRCEN